MLHTNLNEKVVIDSSLMDWVSSPSGGVWRKPLSRQAAETGIATSIVKYEAGASFSEHLHPKGEEILVIEGTFSDEHGDYPAGTYLRNPPGSTHSPFSKNGCVLFVKLNQFSKGDVKKVVLNTMEQSWFPGFGGLEVMPLHNFESENVALVKWPKGEVFQAHRHFGGEEILVLSGTFYDEHGVYPKLTWLRSPHMSSHHPFVKDEETIIFVKTGHLNEETSDSFS